MILPSLSLNLGSERPERLIAFYRDVVGLRPAPDVSPGAFALGQSYLIVSGHDEVRGPAADAKRCLINFVVDDLDAEQARLEAGGAAFVRSKGEEVLGRAHLHLPRPGRQPLPADRDAGDARPAPAVARLCYSGRAPVWGRAYRRRSPCPI